MQHEELKYTLAQLIKILTAAQYRIDLGKRFEHFQIALAALKSIQMQQISAQSLATLALLTWILFPELTQDHKFKLWLQNFTFTDPDAKLYFTEKMIRKLSLESSEVNFTPREQLTSGR